MLHDIKGHTHQGIKPNYLFNPSTIVRELTWDKLTFNIHNWIVRENKTTTKFGVVTRDEAVQEANDNVSLNSLLGPLGILRIDAK